MIVVFFFWAGNSAGLINFFWVIICYHLVEVNYEKNSINFFLDSKLLVSLIAGCIEDGLY